MKDIIENEDTCPCGCLKLNGGKVVDIDVYVLTTDDDISKETFEFYHHEEVRSFVEEQMILRNGIILRYTQTLEMCTLCGDYTHPSEFCLSKSSIVKHYTEQLNLNGQRLDIIGEIMKILLPPGMELELTTLVSSCDMITFEHSLEGKDLFDKRAPIIMLHKNPTDLGEYMEYQNYIGGCDIIERFEMTKKMFIDVNVIWNVEEDSTLDWKQYIIHCVDTAYKLENMFTPLSILEDKCTIPVSDVRVYLVQNESVSRGDFRWFDKIGDVSNCGLIEDDIQTISEGIQSFVAEYLNRDRNQLTSIEEEKVN